MWNFQFVRSEIAAALVLGVLAVGPPAAAQSLSAPIRIGTSTARYNHTLGIPRWKAYMRETNPNQFWACYTNGGRTLSNMTYTGDGGETWSTNAIQIDPDGYLDMHVSVFGRNGNLYAAYAGRAGITFRKFSAPIHNNADAGPPVPMIGTTGGHRSNLMVQPGGRVWIFTRLSYDDLAENVLYNYSDDDGVTWHRGTAYATNHNSVRIGSMPYIGGNPALVVLHLADSRGFEYYLWNGTSFVAQPDHSIYAANMKQTRAFTHNQINDSTFHLVFGLGADLHHVWKHFNGGTGPWNHEIIESSASTLDMDWLPTSTVRGDDLYLFYARKSTPDRESSMIYYRKWSQNTETWSDPMLVSTDAANTSNLDPNTTFRVPTNSPYVPVIWRCGTSPFDIYFAKVVVDESPQVIIDCPPATIDRQVCGATEICIPLQVANATDVTVVGASWQSDTLCLSVDTAGIYSPEVIAVNDHDTAACIVPVRVTVEPSVAITCPADTIEIETCRPASLSILLPIANQTDVEVAGATWLNNYLSFNADTSGVYSFTVSAAGACTTATCLVLAKVQVWPSVDLYLSDVDIAISDPGALPGQSVTLSAIIHSSPWSLPVTAITVQFFDGDPNAGGVQIGADQITPLLTGGHADTAYVQYVVTEPLPRTIYVLLDPDDLIAECNEDNNYGLLTIEGVSTGGSVFGIVSVDELPIYGVVVDLLDGDGYEHLTTTTDTLGSYQFAMIPAGNYIPEVVIPVGFGPISPATVPVTVAGEPIRVDFSLYGLTLGSVTDFWWWKRQIQAIRDGAVLSTGITRPSIDTYCTAIYNHFYDRTDGYAIRISGVTCAGVQERAPTFDDVATWWLDEADASNAAKNRKYFLACFLNIVTSRLSQSAAVSVDGATASQAMMYFADKYTSGDSNDVALGQNLSRIFSRQMIAAGVIPLSTPDVRFKLGEDLPNGSIPYALTLSQNYPNPFNPTTTIAYSVPERSHVLIQVFNVMGQTVRTLVDEEKGVGSHQATWDGRNDRGHAVGSGVYVYRVTSNDNTRSKKMLLLK